MELDPEKSPEHSGSFAADRPDESQRKTSKHYEAQAHFSGQGCSFYISSGLESSENPEDSSIVLEDNPDDEDDEFEDALYQVEVEESDIVFLMTEMRSKHYAVAGAVTCTPAGEIFGICKGLFEKDYDIEMLDNEGGSLSMHYPERLLIPAIIKDSKSSRMLDMAAYTQLVKDSHLARCRSRFVAPVILFDNKFICRSATLSNRKGQLYETALKPKPQQDLAVDESFIDSCRTKIRNLTGFLGNLAARFAEAVRNFTDSNKVEEVRGLDYQLMITLNLEFVCDLMIEDRKEFLFINVSSSEKVNRGIFKNTIDVMPYPGCEFFKRYQSAGRKAEGLVFNWDRPDCKAELDISNSTCADFKNIVWEHYKNWDVIDLTKNYFKVFLSRLIRGKGGILIHCISGWDRTPLMISLLRMSLWADDAIHQKLETMEMAYLTLAYDWYLFGHDLPSRLKNHEEILHYCFNFLPHIATDEFSVTKMFEELPAEEKLQTDMPTFTPGRRKVLNDLSRLVLDFYREVIIEPSE